MIGLVLPFFDWLLPKAKHACVAGVPAVAAGFLDLGRVDTMPANWREVNVTKLSQNPPSSALR